MAANYIVITGIYVGYRFKGIEQLSEGVVRIIDIDSCGRSFPKENCILITNFK